MTCDIDFAVCDRESKSERERERRREINNYMTVNNIITGMERKFNCIVIIIRFLITIILLDD